jgi:hypothetical protein
MLTISKYAKLRNLRLTVDNAVIVLTSVPYLAVSSDPATFESKQPLSYLRPGKVLNYIQNLKASIWGLNI